MRHSLELEEGLEAFILGMKYINNLISKAVSNVKIDERCISRV